MRTLAVYLTWRYRRSSRDCNSTDRSISLLKITGNDIKWASLAASITLALSAGRCQFKQVRAVIVLSPNSNRCGWLKLATYLFIAVVSFCVVNFTTGRSCACQMRLPLVTFWQNYQSVWLIILSEHWINTTIKTTSVGDANVSVTEVGVAGWAWSLHGKQTWIGNCK